MGSQSYSYNGFDTRVGKTVGGATASYHRDGAGVTAPLISDTGATYTPGISERRNGVSTFLNSGLKDVAKQTDSTGNVTATRKYDAYGMVIGSTGTWKGPFGYSGSAGYQEDETGLQLLGHRYYDSSTGRFITRDHMEMGRNWYAYCDNNPVNVTDASGLEAGQEFGSMEEAMYDAYDCYFGKARKATTEYAGFVYKKPNGKWTYVIDTTSGDKNSSSITVPKDAKSVAAFHIHWYEKGEKTGEKDLDGKDETYMDPTFPSDQDLETFSATPGDDYIFTSKGVFIYKSGQKGHVYDDKGVLMKRPKKKKAGAPSLKTKIGGGARYV
jgi:RHS repeat-associated protein